jgi:hypothetical protein
VETATREYREDEDVLGSFLLERCDLEGEIAAPELREAYERFCGDLGEKPLNRSVLGKRLRKRGIAAESRNSARFYQGVKLRLGGEWTERA